MKSKLLLFSAALLVLGAAVNLNSAFAQGPNGKSFGFGLQVGEPSALTLRIWTSKMNSWDAAIGQSFMGSPHIQGGYLWHFPDAFNSRIVFLYAGVGAAVGFWSDGEHGIFIKRKGNNYWYYKDDHNINIAARGVFGLNIIPNRSPLDIFLEIDPLIGLVPDWGFDFQAAIGIRFYP